MTNKLHIAIAIGSILVVASGCSPMGTDEAPAELVECYQVDDPEYGGSGAGSGSSICVSCDPSDSPLAQCNSDCGGEDSYPSCGCPPDPGSGGGGSGSSTMGGGAVGAVGTVRGVRSAPIAVEATVIVQAGKPVSVLVTGGTELTAQSIAITAADIGPGQKISVEAGKKIRAAMNAMEGRLMTAGKTVGPWRTTGFKFGIGALFFLLLEGSVMAGQYAASEIGAWTDANNRGENCPKLARWLADASKTPLNCETNNCEDCYAARINSIPGMLTAQTCYADIAAVTGAAIPAIETQVNARAQLVVEQCGGRGGRASSWIPWQSAKRGGYRTTTPPQAKPPFDGVNVPAMETVCPRVY